MWADLNPLDPATLKVPATPQSSRRSAPMMRYAPGSVAASSVSWTGGPCVAVTRPRRFAVMIRS